MKHSDFFIIKLRYYATPYWLRQWHEKGSMIGAKKHQEAVRIHNDFFWSFVERVTNKKRDYFIYEYGLSSTECAIEEIEADQKIVLLSGEGWFTYFIPKEDVELIEWFKENSKHIQSKILRRKRIIFEFHKPTTWRRENYRTSEEIKKLLNNKL